MVSLRLPTAMAIAVLVFGTGVCSNGVPATHDSIRWQGRTIRCGGQGSVTWSYAGVSFAFQMKGSTKASFLTSSTFHSSKSAMLHVYVDGNLTNVVTLPNNSPAKWLDLVDGLDPTMTVKVSGIYITDPITLTWNTLPRYEQIAYRFGVDGTILEQPPLSANQRRLDIYGDSITAGNQINPHTCAADWSGTYGKLLCEGKGIFHNCCDKDVTMNVLGMRVLPGDPTTTMTSQYYEASARPDGILINLGTNDWMHVKRSVSGFVSVYTAFVEQLAIVHGFPAKEAPRFFLGVGPITHSYADALVQVIALLATKNISAHMISFNAPVDRCGHPPYSSHVLMYEQARQVLSSVLGWE